MSSINPSPLPGAESLMGSLDALRQQQQQMISKLVEAHQEATLAAMKAAPAPGKTVAALQAKLTDELTSLQTMVHRTSQTVTDALATGDPAIVKGAFEMTQAALQLKAKELEAGRRELQTFLDERQTSINVETSQLQRMVDKRSQMFDMLSRIIAKYNETARGILLSIGR